MTDGLGSISEGRSLSRSKRQRPTKSAHISRVRVIGLS
jgi:hypothetical protein